MLAGLAVRLIAGTSGRCLILLVCHSSPIAWGATTLLAAHRLRMEVVKIPSQTSIAIVVFAVASLWFDWWLGAYNAYW
jgi:hypothetical protein